MRAAAPGGGGRRPSRTTRSGSVGDDHYPFLQQGVPAIDLIDFDFACFHRICDNLSVVSERSLDAVGETMVNLLASL